jgi:hypothetical protein
VAHALLRAGVPSGPGNLAVAFSGPTNRSVVTSSAEPAGQPIASIHRSDQEAALWIRMRDTFALSWNTL